MSDAKGAAIAHLANNADVLSRVNGMSPQAAAFIESSVKPSIEPKIVTSAPDPVQPVVGGGGKVQDEFDRICPALNLKAHRKEANHG